MIIYDLTRMHLGAGLQLL